MYNDYHSLANIQARNRGREETRRVRETSGANYSRHFQSRRREATVRTAPPPEPILPLPNPYIIWRTFNTEPIFFKMENPSYSPQDTMKVKIMDPSTLDYPIDFLKFQLADKNKVMEYEAQSMAINDVYKSLRLAQVTIEHILTDEYLVKGNVAIILEHDEYKRAKILETPKPNEKHRRVFCYLLDEGIETMVHESRVFRALKDLWTLPPKIMKFQLARLRRYENTTEFRQLLIKEFTPKPERNENEAELTAEIMSRKSDVHKIVLRSSKYPKETMNEVILRSLFTRFDMNTILSSTNFFPTVKLVGAQQNGDILLQLDTPVFRHLHALLTSNGQQDRFTAAQKKTDGIVKRGETYIYWNPERGTCFRVRCKGKNLYPKSEQVEVLFIDHGTFHNVNRMRLARVKYIGSNKLPFNILTIIPPQSVKAHLADIELMNLTDFGKLFDRQQDSFYLRKTQKLGKRISYSALVEVELFADYLKGVPLEQTTSLNKLILESCAGTQGQLVSVAKPRIYTTRDFSSFAPVNPEGANWGTPNGKFVPLQVGEVLEIIVISFEGCQPGELFVRSALAYSSSLLNTIHKECENYLAEFNRGGDKICECLVDGFHFVVEDEVECTRLNRIRLTDRALETIEIIKDHDWDTRTDENLEKKAECLFVDRGMYGMVDVGKLRPMNPAVAMYPAQGALAIWTFPDHEWRQSRWEGFMKYAINRRFKAKVLALSHDTFGRPRFEMSLYKITKPDNDAVLLLPKDRFWESQSSSKSNFPSSSKNSIYGKSSIFDDEDDYN